MISKEAINRLKSQKMFNKLQRTFKAKGFELYNPYQVDGVKWMNERETNKEMFHPGGILADECGLGKTVQTLATMWANRVEKTLIVAPQCVLKQWYVMAKKFFPKAYVKIHHGNIRAKTEKELEGYFKKEAIIITTYGMIVNGRKTKKNPEPVNSILQSVTWDRVVADEIHYLRNPRAKQTVSFRQLKAKIVWGLTGTPVQNNIRDLKTIYQCLKFPDYLLEDNSSYYSELNSRYILRRTKDEVVDMIGEMPEIEVNIVETPFRHDYERKLYNDTANQIFTELKKGHVDSMFILELYLRLRQVCIHPQVMLDGLAKKFGIPAFEWPEVSTKFQVIGEMMDGHRDEKTLVFCYFKKEMDMLEKYLGGLGWSVFRIDGSRNIAERTADILAAKKSTEPTVMLIQISAGAVGMNLQFASRTYFTSPNWNPSVEIQAIARTHRIGQTRSVVATKIVIKEDDIIEDLILSKQIYKREIMARVLNDVSLVENGERMCIE